MPDTFKLIKHLRETPSLQPPLVSLIEALGKVLDAAGFKPFLPSILAVMLTVFGADMSEKMAGIPVEVFIASLTSGVNIEEYLQLVIPTITKTCERPIRRLSSKIGRAHV